MKRTKRSSRLSLRVERIRLLAPDKLDQAGGMATPLTPLEPTFPWGGGGGGGE